MPRKKQTSKKTKELKPLDIQSPEETTLTEKPKIKFNSLLTIIILVILFFLLGSFIYKNKKLFIVGTINGRPVTSMELYSKLVTQSGKQMLDQIITEKLLKDEATKRKISISQTDIDQEIKKIEESLGTTTTLKDALAQQGMTMVALRDQINLRLAAVKLVEDKVKVTDEDVDKYIKDNKDAITAGEDVAKQKESIKNFLKDQKVSEEIQKLIQDLKSKAKINTFL